MQPQISQPDGNVPSQGNIEKLGRDDEILANLVGYFDVLIQMDLEQKSKEKERKQKDEQSDSESTTSQ